MSDHPHHDHDHSDHDTITVMATAWRPSHSHAPASFDRAFLIGIALNTGFVIAEAAYGFLANSLALLADAGHNLSDVLGLLLAWAAASLAKRPPSARFTYGMKRTPILASLANAMLLLVASGAIVLRGGAAASAPGAGRRDDRDLGAAGRHRHQRRHGAGLHGAAARTTSTSAAPSCTWWRTPWCRSASC